MQILDLILLSYLWSLEEQRCSHLDIVQYYVI